MDFRDLAVPILQAPIGSVATEDLAVAVSNAGAMGSLAMTWAEPQAAAAAVARIKARTSAPFFVNFVLAFEPKAFDAVLDEGVPVVTLSWGHSADLIARAHAKNVSVGVQVGTVQGAQRAARDGADFLICQGVEAGGHVQSTTPLKTLLPSVVEQAAGLPVVATGGLADGGDLKWALDRGASAAMLGTRFVATLESQAHTQYKRAIADASSTDTSFTVCFDGGWPNATHRVLRNSTLEQWEAAGCPPHGCRPGEEDVIARKPVGDDVLRYDDTPAMASLTGEAMDCALFAGLSVDKITDIPSASECVMRIWRECEFSD
ncbi:hypothetical protein BTW10_04655 [Chromohalobacter japonicus]|uniref:2-nitropropane dioxygenase n=1 Tax=Chromohalobacter japonicus TaxID=223900 RepID=A0A1Q8TGF3_9GAMM|nr:nitronate monooxygenase [Chromohalobacter japonicus]OLO12738.1 hypothetical protein BTW10_04655 [Chromohalobacter japonicus]